MRKMFTILSNSFKLTMQELMVNKLRTSLSLIGISFGIFCIIGVLATVNSLEKNIQNQINSLGTNTIYIDKWEYAGGSDYPWWVYMNRPEPQFKEVEFIRERSLLATDVAFEISGNVTIQYGGYALENIQASGVTEDENNIQPLTIEFGRYFSASDFAYGTPVGLIGNDNADLLFGSPQNAVGKDIKVKGNRITVIGVIKKMGQNMIGQDFDHTLMVPYRFARQIMNEDNSNPVIKVKGMDNVTSQALADELEGVMRSIRKLSPTQVDNFSLNQISSFSDQVSSIFSTINLGGWAIGILSLVVGAFGIANIMFVTVKERTPMIGLKKAIGAKKISIMLEFLLEAAIICLLGGIFGLVLVYLLTLVLTNVFDFPVFISMGILSLAVSICIIVGILSGMIPAYNASRLDPVVAIRS